MGNKAMTRDQIRTILNDITGQRPERDDCPVVMSSLHQLEFVFAIEDALEFRFEVPEDVSWTSVNDVARWLESKGELQGT